MTMNTKVNSMDKTKNGDMCRLLAYVYVQPIDGGAVAMLIDEFSDTTRMVADKAYLRHTVGPDLINYGREDRKRMVDIGFAFPAVIVANNMMLMTAREYQTAVGVPFNVSCDLYGEFDVPAVGKVSMAVVEESDIDNVRKNVKIDDLNHAQAYVEENFGVGDPMNWAVDVRLLEIVTLKLKLDMSADNYTIPNHADAVDETEPGLWIGPHAYTVKPIHPHWTTGGDVFTLIDTRCSSGADTQFLEKSLGPDAEFFDGDPSMFATALVVPANSISIVVRRKDAGKFGPTQDRTIDMEVEAWMAIDGVLTRISADMIPQMISTLSDAINTDDSKTQEDPPCDSPDGTHTSDYYKRGEKCLCCGKMKEW